MTPPADAGRGGGQRRPGVRGRGRRASEGGERASEARRARPRAGRAPRARVAAPRAARGKSASNARARDGGFPPARCFVGSAAEGKSDHAGSPFDASRLDPGASARSRGRIPRDRARDRALASASRATDPRGRGARAAPPNHRAAKEPREAHVGAGKGVRKSVRRARARAPRTSRRAPTRSARIRSPSARRRFAATRVDRPMCVRRSPRARRRKWRARAGMPVARCGKALPFRSREAALSRSRGVTNPRCQCARFPGSRNRQSRDPTSSRDGWGRSPPVRHGSKTQIDRSPLRFQATVTSGFSRDPLERFDSPDRTRDRPLGSDGSTIRRFTHRGFFRPARDRPRIAKPNPRSGAPRSRVGTKSTERS